MQETQEIQVQSLGQEDLLEEEMAIHSTILAWKIPQTEEPGGLQSRGSQGVGHDLVTEHMSTHQGLEKTGVGFLAHGTRCFKSTSDGGVGVTKEDIYFFFCLKSPPSHFFIF